MDSDSTNQSQKEFLMSIGTADALPKLRPHVFIVWKFLNESRWKISHESSRKAKNAQCPGTQECIEGSFSRRIKISSGAANHWSKNRFFQYFEPDSTRILTLRTSFTHRILFFHRPDFIFFGRRRRKKTVGADRFFGLVI